MCGILVYLKPPTDLEYLRCEVKNRGPDYYGHCSCDEGITFESSVLSLRVPLTEQPLCDDEDILCYNGQIYSKDLNEQDDVIQDTVLFRNTLRKSVRAVYDLEGEFAFVYFDKNSKNLYFGRDISGRRSLCYFHDPTSGQLIISSVGGRSDFLECDGGGVIYKYNVENQVLETLKVLDIEQRFAINRNSSWELESQEVMAEKLVDALQAAVTRRCKRPPNEGISLLFSGGIDCTILAALIDRCLEPGVTVDLLNIAFENRRTNSLYNTPDRLLARRSLENLDSLAPNRFRLIEIDVPYEKAQEHKERVKRLMLPTDTVMDLSIALAFYFASEPIEGHRNSRILFSGLGADELFAGYSRHTTAAQAGDANQLAEELSMDFLRLPHRNLGRDDRVISSWGREVRYPFLDNDVVQLAMKLPLDMKTDGITTKKILRSVALILKLDAVVHEKKRAIQFGARSAKMDPGSGAAKGHQSL